MPSLLEMYNEIQKLEWNIKCIEPMIIRNITDVLHYDKNPRVEWGKSIQTGFYFRNKQFIKEETELKKIIIEEYDLILFTDGDHKHKNVFSDNKKGKNGGVRCPSGKYMERVAKLENYQNALNDYYENYLPPLYEKYKVPPDINEKLSLMKKQYEHAKLEQERQKAEEHLKMRTIKMAENKINRLKKQNDIKTFCECCNKEYASRNFKTHLKSEKHKKNAYVCEKQTDTDEV